MSLVCFILAQHENLFYPCPHLFDLIHRYGAVSFGDNFRNFPDNIRSGIIKKHNAKVRGHFLVKNQYKLPSSQVIKYEFGLN